MSDPVLLVVACEPDDTDELAGILWGHGPTAVEERDTPDGPALVAGFSSAHAAALATEDLDHRFTFELWRPSDDGLDGWRSHARIWRAGRVIVTPPWLDPARATDARLRPAEGDVVVSIDARRTFGAGSHPTTRLALEACADLDLTGRSVLDVGCGSGVVAVAAAMMGAGSVHAIDIDPHAVETTTSNAERNGVAEVVTGRVGDVVTSGPIDADVTVMNVPVEVHRRALIDVADGLRAGSVLVLTGFLDDLTDEMVEHLGATATVVGHRTADGWAVVEVRLG